jgi:hypothetical protein
MFVASGIRHAVRLSEIPACFLLLWKTAFWWLSLVASGMWSLSFVFVEPVVAQHYWHWPFLALMELLRWLNIICTGMVIPLFGCAVCFNPWFVDFISGPSSCENQPWFSWLTVELLSLLQVKIGLIRNLLFVAYSILLGCYVLWPSLQLL